GFRVDLEIQFRRKTGRAQHAHRILAVTRGRIADQAQAPLFEILDAADVIDYAEIGDVVVQRVDAEIAAQRVFLDAAPDVVAQDAAIDHVAVLAGIAFAGAAERRD